MVQGPEKPLSYRMVRGKAGMREYKDEAVNDPAIKRVGEESTAVGDPLLTED
jgi:hypothetical protein